MQSQDQALIAAASLELLRRKEKLADQNIKTDLLPHQIPPGPIRLNIDGEWKNVPWRTWVLRTGRGAGKNYAAARYTMEHLREYGQDARVTIGAPTAENARDVCMEGKSGVFTLYRDEIKKYNRSKFEAWHIAGGRIKIMGSEKPDRWNGPEHSLIWADELALWNKESWDMALFGLRIGANPQAIVTSTPKMSIVLQKLEEEETTVVTTAETDDNPFLDKGVRDYLYKKYGGTSLADSELKGKHRMIIPGALFKPEWIKRAPSVLPSDMRKIVVAVDPAMTHNLESAETAVSVAGIDKMGEYFVFKSEGYKVSPEQWAKNAVAAFHGYGASNLIGEANNGGEMVRTTIRSVDNTIPCKIIHATKGKHIRAEPVAALYEQGRVHHVGEFNELEDQMCSFTGDDSTVLKRQGHHYDRLDTMVYCILELMNKATLAMVNAQPWCIERKNPWGLF